MQISTLKKLDFFKNKNFLSLGLLANQGYCNNNYKLSTSNQTYLIREFKNNDINRSLEFKIQKSTYHKNIAPQPFFLNQDNSFMVTDFIDGIHKIKLTNIELIKLVQKVKKLHLIKIKMKEHNLKKDFIFYIQTLKDKDSKLLIKQSLKELFKLKRFKKELVLTHHDLNPKNIIFTKNSIKIIDWEYAGVNDLFFDLASLCYEFNLSRKEEQLLLKVYFKKVNKKDIHKLNSYKIIYKNLCLLWFKSLNKD
jgi:thiamine kinase-like enzyme